jgi:hypothetical protein
MTSTHAVLSWAFNHSYYCWISITYRIICPVTFLLLIIFSFFWQSLVNQMEPRQMRTFRTEFNIFESSTMDTTECRSYSSSVHYATHSEWVLLWIISLFNSHTICSEAALFFNLTVIIVTSCAHLFICAHVFTCTHTYIHRNHLSLLLHVWLV